MAIRWPAFRYGAALTVSITYAMLVLGGFGMGGPQAVFGWAMLALFISLPILVWWTKDGRVAAVVQAIPLLIAASSAVYLVVVASQS